MFLAIENFFSPMKLLVFAPYFPPDPTGSSLFAYQQSIDLKNKGHQILTITNERDKAAPAWATDPDQNLGTHDIDVIRLSCKRVSLGRLSWNYRLPVSVPGLFRRSVRHKLLEHNPDGVIIHSTLFDLSLFALLWSAIHKRRNILVCHTALWHDLVLVRWCMYLFGFFILRPLCVIAKTRIVCVDKFTFENAQKVLGKKRNTVIVPISVDISTLTGGDADFVSEKYRIQGTPIILSLGHVIPLRDRVNLIRSLPILIKGFPDIKIIIVGMVKDDTAFKLAQELGVASHIISTGAVSHKEIFDFLALAHIEMHDLNGLGLGITSLEAMASKTPIIAWIDPENYPALDRDAFPKTGFINSGDPKTISEMVIRIVEDDVFAQEVVCSQEAILKKVFSLDAIDSQYIALLTS